MDRTLKRHAPGQQLVGHDRQGVLVRGGHGLSSPLFRGHVGGCPDHFTGGCSGLLQPRNAKVRQQQIRELVGGTLAADQEIGGFHVPVDDLGLVLVGVLQGRGRLFDQVGHLRERELTRLRVLGSPAQPGEQRAFRPVGHDQVGQQRVLYLFLPAVVKR